ncbi:MAG: AIR synthase-related protein, partial [Planctomycetota bacterium]
SDAAVVAPLLGRDRGVAVSCGLNTCYGDVDAYHAAAAGIEEALRNLVCVGAPLDRVALLDNFSWGRCDRPENLGALVRACQACYDLAMFYGTPFVSGKDSLNNEYAHGGETIVIPHTLLITAFTVMPDVTRALTMDCKRAGDVVLVVGETRRELGGSEYLAARGASGGLVPRLDREHSRAVLRGVEACIARGLVTAAHDCSDGGLATTLAEMAFAGGLGMEVDLARVPCSAGVDRSDQVLFSESLSRIVITVGSDDVAAVRRLLDGVPHEFVGTVTEEPVLQIRGLRTDLRVGIDRLQAAWRGGLAAPALQLAEIVEPAAAAEEFDPDQAGLAAYEAQQFIERGEAVARAEDLDRRQGRPAGRVVIGGARFAARCRALLGRGKGLAVRLERDDVLRGNAEELDVAMHRSGVGEGLAFQHLDERDTVDLVQVADLGHGQVLLVHLGLQQFGQRGHGCPPGRGGRR